ncbi:ABC transporter permease subunit [Ochrobactrum chromiisoli]|uniref:ABC transporter permease subunit n=1 Tax=Ochrobactrum chromiisoli TaxID=2993941 RepID=A0ABT3QSG9_9HYPH|nr:ABC transporter permease subunit [Ochrobactrum chromiisoli]MCX2698561.1 ABC transporter permease subunit [Ochrobactrum chromiisoli]
MIFEWSAIIQALPELLKGAGNTIWIAVVALSAGIVSGTIMGLIRTYGPRYISMFAQAYIGAIRGTPLVVQIMFIYFALPMLAGVRMSATSAGIIGLIINSSAYFAEIVRGGLLSVPKGLKEAGFAVGLPFRLVLILIILPIAFRRMVPALGNQFIIGLKDTSLLIVIGVAELTRTGQEIMTENYRAVEIWFAVAVIYLLMISAMAMGFRWLEKRAQIS